MVYIGSIHTLSHTRIFVRRSAINVRARWPSWLERWLGMATGHSRPLAIPFTPLCQCLSDETLKAVGPFYLVSMPGEIKDPTSLHWNV